MRFSNFVLIVICFAILLSYLLVDKDISPTKTASTLSTKKMLPLKCTTITGHQEQLCIIKTESRYGPYDDIVYYHLTGKGLPSMLGSEGGGVGTFGGFEFSDSGKYMWLSWAEEGHPHFRFYRTSQFLENGPDAKTLHVVGDYEFEQFIKFTDAGEVTYLLNTQDDIDEFCEAQGEEAQIIIDPSTSNKSCAKEFKLN